MKTTWRLRLRCKLFETYVRRLLKDLDPIVLPPPPPHTHTHFIYGHFIFLIYLDEVYRPIGDPPVPGFACGNFMYKNFLQVQ